MKPKRKIIISLAISGAVILMFIVLILYPLFDEIQKISYELILQKEELVNTLAKTEGIKEFQEFYRANKLNFEEIDTLFIDLKTPIEFIKFLEGIAADSQVFLKINPGGIQRENSWTSLTFQLSLSGSFPNILKFIEKIESSPYLLQITDLRADASSTALSIKAFAE